MRSFNFMALSRLTGEPGAKVPSVVTLSACDSGVGRVSRGDELWGFTRSFLSAGTRTLVVSLWPVEDEATSRWMRELYRARLDRRLTTAGAMRAASLATLQDLRARRLDDHPSRWAGFVAAGDWH